MQHGIDVELAVTGPHLTERDSLGVAKKPGGLVVQGGNALFQRSDPEEYIERLALTAEGFAAWGSAHAFQSGYGVSAPRYPVNPGLVKRFT
jgi:hypothetical protein